MEDKKPKTLFDKIWDSHVVYRENKAFDVLYIDLHLIHEVTSPQAFSRLRELKLPVRRPDKTFATADHNVPTTNQMSIRDKISRLQVETLEKNCRQFNIRLFGLDSPYQGIVHVIAPELGLAQPGMTVVCGDSHTSTLGALGTVACGIGSTEVAYVLATQCLIQTKPENMQINIEGRMPKGVSAKDIILKIISDIGVNGGRGYAIEYTGQIIKKMNMEERMTVCNMSIETGARYGLTCVDEKTLDYLKNRKFTLSKKKWNDNVKKWQMMKSDKGAKYDKVININVSELSPMITYGTTPEMVIAVDDNIPHFSDLNGKINRQDFEEALSYMNLKPGMKLKGFAIDEVFIGSCTNARLSDLEAAAKIIKGKKVKKGIKAIVVPGSRLVKKAAEGKGLDRIFRQAGFSWRWSGCSACIAMNEDRVEPGHYCVSTSNRNYQGRQGPGARTILASPITAAACAISGRIVDVREYL